MEAKHVQKLRHKRARLIQRRKKILKALRRTGDWAEFHAVCEDIAKLDTHLRSAAAAPRVSATVARIFRQMPGVERTQPEE
jgi:hypothetical protein